MIRVETDEAFDNLMICGPAEPRESKLALPSAASWQRGLGQVGFGHVGSTTLNDDLGFSPWRTMPVPVPGDHRECVLGVVARDPDARQIG